MSGGLDIKLDQIVGRAAELRAMLSEGVGGDVFAKASKELSDLEPVVERIGELRAAERAQAEAEALLADPEMKGLAEAELYDLKERLPALRQEIRLALLPRDEADSRSAILEVRPAAGGDEAGLFAAELFGMYQKYAVSKGWRFEVLDYADNELGGIKEAVAEITGRNVFARLKYESGVHRVQRVPATESQGRIHTSTVTVAVLPEAEEVDVDIDEGDLRIDVYRASGAGGQHVNKTESAVRITHIPSGVVVAMQEERSQHKNRAKAMKLLRSRLFEAQRAREAASRAADRKGQVGTGDRSERIRTYNFPQGRVSDHRIGLTLHNIDRVMAGRSGRDRRPADRGGPGGPAGGAGLTVREALRFGAARLEAAGIEGAAREARLLLEAATGLSRETLLLEPDRAVDEGDFLRLVERRAAREPLAFILGVQEFWSLPFRVSPATLIPRADSETLIEAALAARPDGVGSVLDLGTGTGLPLARGAVGIPGRLGRRYRIVARRPRCWRRRTRVRSGWPTGRASSVPTGRRRWQGGSIWC